MSELYPLQLLPEFHERVWGTRDLSAVYHHPVTGEPVGEAWLSADSCRVANGPLAGKTLGELCREHGAALCGERVERKDRYPLLNKMLFPMEKLSVQVHPDDARAAAVGEPCGKTECWYVAHAEPGAAVGLGLKPGVSRESFGQAILGEGAEQLLNWIPVQEGDLIFVGAGAVHAIGPGAVLIEAQQNSDTTYRLYDYNRGRELHIEQGLGAILEHPVAGRVAPRTIAGYECEMHSLLVSSPNFAVERFAAREVLHFATKSVAQVLVGAAGRAEIDNGSGIAATLEAGTAVVLPATATSFTVTPVGRAEFLRVYVPACAVAEPEAIIPA
jgi:mannose-6-phosphate isomerase